jgi:hypothetical protein
VSEITSRTVRDDRVAGDQEQVIPIDPPARRLKRAEIKTPSMNAV